MLNFFKPPSKTKKNPNTTNLTDKQKQQTVCDDDPDGTIMLSPANRTAPAPIAKDSPVTPTSSIPMASTSHAKLVDQRKTGGLGEFHLTNAVTIVSRKSEWGMSNANLLLVNDAGISRNHANIERRHVDFWLRDLGSTNGTYINNVLLKDEVKLKHGDLIRFHQVEFCFMLTNAES